MPVLEEKFAGKSILLTGGSGFLGRRLAARLGSAGADVMMLARPNAALPAGRAILAGSWTPSGLIEALSGLRFDGIFNLAAYGVVPSARDAAEMTNVNVDCAQALLRHAIDTKARFFVHTGSSAEYAANDDAVPLTENASVETEKLYGSSKAAATELLLAEADRASFPCAVARVFGVYGPGEAEHRLLPSLWSRLSRSQRVPLSPGKQIRDFCHVDDVAEGLLAIAGAVTEGGRPLLTNLCSGEGVSIGDFARQIAHAMAVPEILLGFGDLPLRPDDLLHVVGSTKRLHAISAWRPRFSLEAGVAAALSELALGAR